MVATLKRELITLSNKARYIQEVLSGTIDLRKKKKTEIIDLLNSKQYNIIDDDCEFKYLVKMPMDSVSDENVEKVLKDHETKQLELEQIVATSIEQMWLQELSVLEQEYELYREERQRAQFAETAATASQANKKKKVVKKLVKRPTIANIVLEESA